MIDAPVTPSMSTEKSAALTPVTARLKCTVKLTLVALLGFVLARTIEFTVAVVELLMDAE